MTDDDRLAFSQAFLRWFKGNVYAVSAAMDLLEVAHLWDDLVDGDDVNKADADHTMRKAMLDLPFNPFWRDNLSSLMPVLQSVYLQWKVANVLDNSSDQDDLNKAYMLRASLYQVFHYMAALCGGIEWAEEIGPEVYRLYGEVLKMKGDDNA